MSRYFGDGFCGPGFTEVQMPSGAPDCWPDATTSPPVPPPIDWNQIYQPPIQPRPQGNNNPAHPVGVELTPPPLSTGGNPFASQSGMLLLLGGAALLFLAMKGGGGGGGRR